MYPRLSIESEDIMTFPEHLLLLRRSHGLKQMELAKKIGLSWKGYQNYELGLREPKLSTLIALADFYGITIDDLVCHSQPGK